MNRVIAVIILVLMMGACTTVHTGGSNTQAQNLPVNTKSNATLTRSCSDSKETYVSREGYVRDRCTGKIKKRKTCSYNRWSALDCAKFIKDIVVNDID